MKSLLLVMLVLSVGCGSSVSTSSAPALEMESFFLPTFALAAGQERTLCRRATRPAFDRIGHISWQIAGNVHHAALQVQRSPETVAPGACPEIADTIHVWISGGDDALALETVGLVLPEAPLFIEAHLFGPTALDADIGRVTIREAAVEKTARLLSVSHMKFRIEPNSAATVTVACPVEANGWLLSFWPHMHARGTRITLTGSGFEELVDPWDGDNQPTYSVAHILKPSTSLSLRCEWFNPMPTAVLAGPRRSDEMCGFAGVVTPPAAIADCHVR